MKAATLIIFLTTMTVAKHHHRSNRKSIEAKDFFIKINEDIHNFMEKIFESINLNENFTQDSNIRRLLTMHYDLSNIAEKNVESLYDVQNASQAGEYNQTEDRIRLDNAVEQILKEKKIDVYEQIKGKKHKHRHRHERNKTEVNDNSELRESEELMNFVIDFLEHVSNTSVQELKKTTKRRKRPFSYRRNLKVWEPPPNIKVHVNAMTRRVFNGMKTTVKKFPFIVSVHIMGEFACAGSIISRDIIITAATCLQEAHSNKSNVNIKSIYVRLGSEYIDRDGETIPIQEMFFHPEFESDILKNNLVLVKLEKRIRFSKHQSRIRRILYDTNRKDLNPHGEGVLILGWGATAEDQVVKRDQKLSLDVLDLFDWENCKNLYTENYVNKENFCAGMSEKRGGACNGDVGGPGVVGAVLMGIVSFGAPVCGSSDAPTVFLKLGYYKDWIESVLKPKPSRRKSMIWRDHFNRRNFYNADRRIHSSKSSKKRLQVPANYPEEVSVLKEILGELVKSNTDMVDELLYGDLYADFNDIFISREEPNDGKHATTPMTKVIELSETIETSEAKKKKPRNEVLRNTNSDANSDESPSDEYTDNYESSSSEEGMSIEVITTVTNKVLTSKKVIRHHSTKKLKATTTVTTKRKQKRKKTHHEYITRPMARQLTEPPKKKNKKKHVTHSDETASDEKKRSDKIDETKAVELNPLAFGKQLQSGNKQYIKDDNMDEIKQIIGEDNISNNKEKNKDEANFKDYFNLANKFIDNGYSKPQKHKKYIKEEKKDKDKDVYHHNDNNKIANKLKSNIQFEINSSDDYKDDTIIIGNNKDNVNIEVTDNQKQSKNTNNNQAGEEDDSETEKEDKSALRKLEGKENIENSNDQKQDSMETYQNATSPSYNLELPGSDEHSFTTFKGTHMDHKYATIALKLQAERIRKKKKKTTPTSDIEDNIPTFHAVAQYGNPAAELWKAFFNMKLA